MWEVLHAGKFVGDDGVVLERAEHEFLARSTGFPESLVRLIARQDPTPRLRPVPWTFGRSKVELAFAQTTIRLDGANHVLRIIDHRAFEGPADRPGRPYRRRTYLYNPAWEALDAALPIETMAKPPSFTRSSTVPALAPSDAGVDLERLAIDLATLLDAGRVRLGPINKDTPGRIQALLAALPPPVAARLEIHAGDGATAIIQAGGDRDPPGDPTTGQALLEVLHDLGADATLAGLARAAAKPSPVPLGVALDAVWERLHPELAWQARAGAWRLQAIKALRKNREVPAPPGAPSARWLGVALPVLDEHDALDRLGPLGDKAWQDAWVAAQVPPAWLPVKQLLAGGEADPDALANLPLAGPAAARAIAAVAALPSPGAAVLASRQTWCKDLREAYCDRIVEAALRDIAAAPATWDGHPVRRLRQGIALQALLEGAPSATQDRTLKELGQAGADVVASLGDAAANARWIARTGRPGAAANPDPAVDAALRILTGRHIDSAVDARRFAATWKVFGLPFDPAAALQAGLATDAVEATLPQAPYKADAGLLLALLHRPDADLAKWRAWSGTAWDRELGAWLSKAPPEPARAALEAWPPGDIPPAACLYAGPWPRSWREAGPAVWLAWLRQGGALAPVARLAQEAPATAATALTAFLATRNADGAGTAQQSDAAVMLDGLLSGQGWLARRAIQRDARRLQEAT